MLSLVASLDSGTRRRLGQSSEYDGTVAARPRGRWVHDVRFCLRLRLVEVLTGVDGYWSSW